MEINCYAIFKLNFSEAKGEKAYAAGPRPVPRPSDAANRAGSDSSNHLNLYLSHAFHALEDGFHLVYLAFRLRND
jgi:hypothetical protein